MGFAEMGERSDEEGVEPDNDWPVSGGMDVGYFEGAGLDGPEVVAEWQWTRVEFDEEGEGGE